ncbi:carboxylesterase/lipase family protein [Hyalangium versicolor]|uniref:carboxylesterase/lipase family protein n=1 Tax=Hyalangium versicolor TaxID=2861190 RepID=UPI001CCEB149|nr:carboxylesterase family protein [Hyalangium versicolor]
MTIKTTPSVETVEGPVQGALIEPGVVAYMGIPYAAPPTGQEGRWRAPRPVQHWTEPRPSDVEEPRRTASCLQNQQNCILVGGGDPGTMDEDCLYLNVWTPERAAGASKLPVMVWIHGGAYIIGAGRLPVYHGAPLVKRGVILVTLNYRMGALGFFAHEALEKERLEKNEPRVNNFGLLDQIAALEWVQRNIAAFGGDPDKVTIFGQSAGARSVLALFASPLVREGRDKPLFHQGIAQSVYRFPEASQTQALNRGKKLMGLLKVSGTDVTAEQLRGLSARDIMNMDGKLTPQQLQGTSNSPVAISGDSVLPNAAGVIDSFLKGEVAALPLIIGNTSDDGSVVLDVPGIDTGSVLLLAATGLPAPIPNPDVPRNYYPDLASEAGDVRSKVGRRLTRDAVFTVTTYNIAKAHSKIAPTWRYYFDYTAENHRATVPDGTRHGDDVAFTMDTLAYAPPFPPGKPKEPVEVTEKDRRVAALANEYVVTFAISGTPSAVTGPEWPQDKAGQDRTLVLGESTQVKSDFMQQHVEAATMENMVAFDKVGKKMDNIMG